MSRRLRRVDTAMLMRALVERFARARTRAHRADRRQPLPSAGPVTTRRSVVAVGPGCGLKATNYAIGAAGRCPRRTVCIQ